jgi:hypothetical protein
VTSPHDDDDPDGTGDVVVAESEGTLRDMCESSADVVVINTVRSLFLFLVSCFFSHFSDD